MGPLFRLGCEAQAWAGYPAASLWPTFFILYNNFLPISLYVTIELCNMAQAATLPVLDATALLPRSTFGN